MSHYLLAVDYFNESKYVSCYEQVDGAINLYNHKVPEYYALRGKAAYYQGAYHEAYLDFKIVLDMNPNNAEILKFMRQFERDSVQQDQETMQPTVESVSRNVANDLEKSKSTGSIKKVPVKPSEIPIVNDPLGVNNDYDKLDRLNKLPQGEETDLSAPIHVSKCTAMLPKMNPYLAASVVYNEAAKPRMNELKETVHSRTSVEESHLWSLIRNAEVNARKMRKPKVEKHAGLTEVLLLYDVVIFYS